MAILSTDENGNPSITTKTLRVWKENDGKLLRGELLQKAKLNMENVQENSIARAQLLDPENPIPYIVNIKRVMSADADARKFMSRDTAGLSCVALIVDQGMSKVIANYALLINKPQVPTRAFTNEDQARVWVMFKS